MLYGHGDDGYQYQKEIIADFSTNVWYGGEPAGLKEHLFSNWSKVNRYPEVLAESFRSEVAHFHQVNPEQVLICNGTAEAIYLIAHVFERSQSIIAVPTFSEYEDACQLYHHQLSFLAWEELPHLSDANKPSFQASLAFICNPNNPTGELLTRQQIEQLLLLYPQTNFVIDEAYIGFTLSGDSAVTLLSKYPNLIVLHSLTKTFAIPGLRLGYVLASANAIAQLERVKMPWSVNTLGIEAGKFILRNYSAFKPPVVELLVEKNRFVDRIKEATSFQVKDSQTHYFLVETSDQTAATLKKNLVDHFGILIRDASNFRMLSPQHFRLATLAPDTNDLLIKALQT